ncbi:MAG: DUF6773 family protein [Sarcina sp.]
MKIYNEEERINTQVESINFKGYLILQILTLCVLFIKIVFINISMISISTELVILIVGNLYILIRVLFLRVNLMDFLKGRDEFNLVYRNKFFSQAFYLSFILIGMMTIVILLLGKIYLSCFILIEFFIPGTYVTYKSVKKGLLIPRIKINKKKERTKLVVNLILCVAYTLGTSWEFLKADRSLFIKILEVIFNATAYIVLIAIPIHFSAKAILKKSQKNADKLNN